MVIFREPLRHRAYFSRLNAKKKKKLANPVTFSKWLRRSKMKLRGSCALS